MRARAPMLIVLAMTATLSACGTTRGTAEFRLHAAALREAQAASDAILDRAAAAERKLWTLCTNFAALGPGADPAADCVARDSEDYEFAPSHAPYISDAGDPPAAAALRRAVAASAAYAAALEGLADGRTAEAMAGRLGELADIAATAALAAVPQTGAGPLAGISGAASDLNDDVAALQGPLSTLFGFATRDRFREELLARRGTMDAALAAMIEATPQLREMMLNAALIGARSEAALDAAAARDAQNVRLLANWVLMLDASRATLDAAADAAAGEGAGTAGLIAASRLLADAARDARRALSGVE